MTKLELGCSEKKWIGMNIMPMWQVEIFQNIKIISLHFEDNSFVELIYDKAREYSFFPRDINIKIIKSYTEFRKYFNYNNKHPLFNPFKWFGIEFLVNIFPQIYKRSFAGSFR